MEQFLLMFPCVDLTVIYDCHIWKEIISWDFKLSVSCAQANEGTVIHCEHLIYTNYWDFKLYLLFVSKEMFFNTVMKEKEDYLIWCLQKHMLLPFPPNRSYYSAIHASVKSTFIIGNLWKSTFMIIEEYIHYRKFHNCFCFRYHRSFWTMDIWVGVKRICGEINN